MFSILLLLCLGTTNANCVRSDALLLARLNTLCASLGGSSSNCPAGNATAEGDWSFLTPNITRQTRTNYFTCTFAHKQAKSGRLHEQSAERIGITWDLPQHIDSQRNCGVARNDRRTHLSMVEHLGDIPSEFDLRVKVSSKTCTLLFCCRPRSNFPNYRKLRVNPTRAHDTIIATAIDIRIIPRVFTDSNHH